MKDKTFNAILMTGAILFALYTCNRGTEDAIRNRPNTPSIQEANTSVDSSSSDAVNMSLPDTLLYADTAKSVSITDSNLISSDSTYLVSSDGDSLSNQTDNYKTYEQQEADLRTQQLSLSIDNMELQMQLADQKRREDSANTAALNRYYQEDMERQISSQMQQRLNSLNNNSNYTTVPNFSSGTNPNIVTVDGYYRSNGTYVPSYHRTAPNNTIRDNFSTYPNYNPYTGKTGTRRN